MTVDLYEPRIIEEMIRRSGPVTTEVAYYAELIRQLRPTVAFSIFESECFSHLLLQDDGFYYENDRDYEIAHVGEYGFGQMEYLFADDEGIRKYIDRFAEVVLNLEYFREDCAEGDAPYPEIEEYYTTTTDLGVIDVEKIIYLPSFITAGIDFWNAREEREFEEVHKIIYEFYNYVYTESRRKDAKKLWKA